MFFTIQLLICTLNLNFIFAEFSVWGDDTCLISKGADHVVFYMLSTSEKTATLPDARRNRC